MSFFCRPYSSNLPTLLPLLKKTGEFCFVQNYKHLTVNVLVHKLIKVRGKNKGYLEISTHGISYKTSENSKKFFKAQPVEVLLHLFFSLDAPRANL